MKEAVRLVVTAALVIWGWIVYGVCIINGIEPPTFLLWMVGSLTTEFVGIEMGALPAIYKGMRRLLK